MSATMDDATLLAQLERDIDRLAQQPTITVELRPTSALQLMATIQLALAHPDYDQVAPQARTAMQRLARYLQRCVSITPALADLCERGWRLGDPPPTAAPTRSAGPSSPASAGDAPPGPSTRPRRPSSGHS